LFDKDSIEFTEFGSGFLGERRFPLPELAFKEAKDSFGVIAY